MKLNIVHKKQLLKIKGMKDLQKLHKKYARIKGTGGKKMLGSGEDFWGKVGSFISKSAGDVNDFLKKTKIISRGSSLAKYVLPAVGLAEFIPVTETAGRIAENLGYGRGGGQQFNPAPSLLGTGKIMIQGSSLEPSVQGTMSNATFISPLIDAPFYFNSQPRLGGQVKIPQSGPWVFNKNGMIQPSNASLISGKGNQTEFNAIASTRPMNLF